MRKSCHEQNRKMLQAYQLYHKGQYSQSLIIYESILDKTSAPQLKYNLICTISVIAAALGNYNYAIQLLEHNILQMAYVPVFVKLRYYSNMCFLQIILGLYEQAIYTFSQIKQIIIGADDHRQAMQFVLKLFFRVSSIQEIQYQTMVSTQINLMQAFYLLNLAFAKDICGFKGSQNLLKSAYTVFVANKKMQLAVVCLRQLLLLPLNSKQILKYEKQLSKVMSMNIMQEYQLDNAQSSQCCKLIAQQLVLFSKQLGWETKKPEQKIQLKSGSLWKIVLIYQNRKLLSNSSIAQEQKNTIINNIQIMIKQKNDIIIQAMKKSDFYISAARQIESILYNTFKIFSTYIQKSKSSGLKRMYEHSQTFKQQKTRNKSCNSFDKKVDKENKPPTLISRDRSQKSLLNNSTILSKSEKDLNLKTNQKMIKFCEYGSFLSKRNFNSDGGQYRFVRITQSVLKWAKNPEKIQSSCQLYPLKDINSIHYGKLTPTMLKQSNKLLKEQFCFSLRLQKRTLDFYCKNFQEVSSWVCGFTLKLRQINPKFRGYSVGKILWKRMFFILKQNFTQKKRAHERNFYYETAQAIILFGKNNYKLPNKITNTNNQ